MKALPPLLPKESHEALKRNREKAASMSPSPDKVMGALARRGKTKAGTRDQVMKKSPSISGAEAMQRARQHLNGNRKLFDDSPQLPPDH
jgi:hypothetical protein